MKKNSLLIFVFIFLSTLTIKSQVCFVPHQDYPTGASPQKIVSVDFNNDGNLDVIVPSSTDRTISVMLGNGNGALTTSSTFTITPMQGPKVVNCGHFNSDGLLDIVYITTGGAVWTALNNGAGSFAGETYVGVNAPVGLNSSDVVIGDFNSDGFNDLVFDNYTSANVSLYLGDGAGNFSSGGNTNAGSFPKGLAKADLNGDNFLDIVTANNGANSISVLLGNGAGSFTKVNYPTLSTNPYSVVATDIDIDGDKDLVVCNGNSLDLSVFFNNGLGAFGAATLIAAPQALDIATADFNGDSKPDVVLGGLVSSECYVMLGNGLGSFDSPISFATGLNPYNVCTGDFNNDGKSDVASSNLSGNTISILLNNILPVVNASVSDNIICATDSIILNGSGATTYSWLPEGTNGIAFPPSGTTTFTVVGTIDGCSDTSTVLVTVLPLPTINLSSTSFSVCIGNTTALNATGDAVSYNWNNGITNGVLFSPLVDKVYTVIATASNGCIKKDSVSIYVNPIPSAIIASGPSAVCADVVYTLSSNGSSGGDIYVWTGPTFANPAGSNPNGLSTDVTATGTYTLTLTNSSTGCVDINTRSIVFNPLPTVTANASSTLICTGTQVTLSGGGADTYTWTGGVNDNTPFNLSSPQTYTVIGTDANNCTNSAIVSVDIYQTPTPEICMVTVDDPGLNNIVYWDKASYAGADTFFVYREVSNNNYQIIGKVPYDSLSMFIDTVRAQYFPNTGDPRMSAYKYKLAIKDTCGNLGAKSLFHKTTFLQDQLNGNFNWNHYEIEGQPLPVPTLTSYLFLRDNNSDGNFETTIGSTNASLTTDPQYFSFQFVADWRIETQWSIACDATLRPANSGDNSVQTVVIKSKSNVRNNRTTGLSSTSSMKNSMLHVYPNPANEILNVEFKNMSGEQVTITVENMLGQIVYESQTIQQVNQINSSSFVSGVYFVKVHTTQGILTQKIVVQ